MLFNYCLSQSEENRERFLKVKTDTEEKKYVFVFNK